MFLQATREHDALTLAGVPLHLREVLAESLQDSWFAIKGRRLIANTRMGTKPGDPLGDILFEFAHAKIMRDIHVETQKSGMPTHILYDDNLSCLSPPKNPNAVVHMSDSTFCR